MKKTFKHSPDQVGQCTHFEEKIIVDVDDDNLQPVICDYCHRPLVEVSDDDGKTPQPPQWKRWIWLLVGAVIIVLIVIFAHRCDKDDYDSIKTIDTTYNECGDTIIINGTDTNIIKNTQITISYNENKDTIIKRGCEILETRTYKKHKPRNGENKPPIKNEPPIHQDGLLGYGKYYGPKNDYGMPHGKGGRVVITNEYKWRPPIVFKPGDVIENTTYENGALRHGHVIPKDGSPYDI